MKKHTILSTLAVVAVCFMGQMAVAGNGNGFGGNRGGGKVFSVNVLSDEEVASLTMMREEEKLARDVYRTLFEQWGERVFTNISDSEQQHMDAIAGKLVAYQVPDPVVDDYTGAFTNPDFAALYLTLIEKGMVSLESALMVGGWIEELDMRDLQDAIDESTHSDIIQVYENLMKGSRNHLRAFVGRLESLGVVYEAQVISQAEVDQIVNEPTERGR